MQDGLIHTFPLEEGAARQHILTRLVCWCAPQPDVVESKVIIHKSYTQWLKYKEGINPDSPSH